MAEKKLFEELKNQDKFKQLFIRAVQPGSRLKNCDDKGYVSLQSLSDKASEWRVPQ